MASIIEPREISAAAVVQPFPSGPLIQQGVDCITPLHFVGYHGKKAED